MTQHTELIAWLRTIRSPYAGASANALEAQAREIAELKAQLAATAKSAFLAMPPDIPRRMKRKICVNAGWSGSMVSRMYAELRKAFTGEPYKANEDLDAALLEIGRLRKDAERFLALERIVHWEQERDMGPGGRYWMAVHVSSGNPTLREAIDAMKGQP